MSDYTLDRPTALTCPDCGGALSPEFSGTLLQYRCHIGHLLTAETMFAAKSTELEIKLASCLAMLNEYAELCRQIAGAVVNNEEYVVALERAAEQAIERAEVLRKLLESEWVLPLELQNKGER